MLSDLSAETQIALTDGSIGLDMSSSSVNIGQCFVATDLSCHDFVIAVLISGTGRVLLDSQIQTQIDTSVAASEPAFAASSDLEKAAGSPPTLGLTDSN